MKVYFFNWTADYERISIDYLRSKSSVDDIKIKKDLWRWHKRLRHVGFPSDLLIRRYIKKKLKDINDDDLIIFKDDRLHTPMIQSFLKELPGKKILLLRNPVSSNYVSNVRVHFQSIYTFEKDKSEQFGIKYTPQFLPIGYSDLNRFNSLTLNNKNKICFFLGRDKSRVSILTMLSEKLKKVGCNIDFSIVKDKTSIINSDFYIEEEIPYYHSLLKMILSDVIVEINQDGQTGYTLRTMEALCFNKKLISNNLNLLNEPFYSSERIFIIGFRKWEELEVFLASKISPLDEDTLYKHSPDFMFNTLLIDSDNADNLLI